MGLCDKFHKLVVVLTILFIVIALAIPQWSTADVSGGLSGSLKIGLWEACGDTSPGELFTTLNGDCRKGHCTRSDKLCKTCGVSSNGLCERSKISASFLLMALVGMVIILYCTSYKSFRKLPENFGLSFLMYIFAALCSLISWTVWAHWNQLISDDPDRTDQGTSSLSEFKLGGAFALVVVVFLFNVFGAFFCYFKRKAVMEGPADASAPRSRAVSKQPLASMAKQYEMNDEDSHV